MGRSQVKFNQTHPHRQKYKSRNNDGNEVRSKSKNTAGLDDIPDQPMLHPPLKLRKDLVQEQALQVRKGKLLFSLLFLLLYTIKVSYL